MGVRRMLSGFAALVATNLFTQVIGFVALAFVARRLGPTNLGAANLALAIALYGGILANFGIAVLGVRDVGREPERARHILGEVLVLRVACSMLVFGAVVALAPVIATDARTEELIPIAAAAILIDAVSVEWGLLGMQRPVAVAVARFAGQIVYAALVLLTIAGGIEGARRFLYATLVGFLITALLTQVFAWRLLSGGPRRPGALVALRDRAMASVPLGVALVMAQVTISAGVILLGYLESNAAVGQFTVAQKVPLALAGLVALWSSLMYAQVARLIDERPGELRGQVELFTRFSLVLALPLSVGALLLGPTLIPFLFGSAYGPAGDIFGLLVCALAVSLLAVNLFPVLAAGGQERSYARGRTIGAVSCVAASAVLIPLSGLTGAAIGALLAEVVVLGYMLWGYRRRLGPLTLDAGHLLRVALATGAMALSVVLADGLAVEWRLLLGAAVYAVAGLALGVVRRSDLASAQAPAA